MKRLDGGKWGLRILALVLAIVIYHALKSDSKHSNGRNDQAIFNQH